MLIRRWSLRETGQTSAMRQDYTTTTISTVFHTTIVNKITLARWDNSIIVERCGAYSTFTTQIDFRKVMKRILFFNQTFASRSSQYANNVAKVFGHGRRSAGRCAVICDNPAILAAGAHVARLASILITHLCFVLLQFGWYWHFYENDAVRLCYHWTICKSSYRQ